MQAILALEDGRIFQGKGFGAKGECYGEVVFNTSITGYQEIFTDTSYAGQIVVLTNPEIGNYGTNPEDHDSTRPYIEGLLLREARARLGFPPLDRRELRLQGAAALAQLEERAVRLAHRPVALAQQAGRLAAEKQDGQAAGQHLVFMAQAAISKVKQQPGDNPQDK